jgi:phage tail sheath protein FI
MSRAKVTVTETDLSTRVPEFPGVYAGILIPDAKKGEVGVAKLMTSETEFLKKYTPDEKVKVGYSLAYYSALTYLNKSNKLWVVRVAKSDSKYGGVIITSSADSVAGGLNTALVSGLVDPTTYFASFVQDSSGIDETILITGKNPGAWNDDISIKVITDPSTVKEPNAFIIEVWKDSKMVETFTCSRVVGALDGFGQNIYIEDVLSASEYIQAVDNLAVDSGNYISESSTAVALNGGDDGSAVTDSDMVAALDALSNRNAIEMSLFLDGGWATDGFHTNVINMCENRRSVALLSVPYAAENSSDFLSEITEYKNVTLNANTSWAGMFSPHLLITDKFNDREIYIAPDGVVGALISQTASNFEMWYPPAGFRRGVINVNDVLQRFTEGQMDSLYDDNVNPIRFAPGRGIVLWGQKTLLSRPSALDRLNVRFLLMIVEAAVEEALRDFLFELNDEITRSIITSMIESYMEGIKARRGVSDFEVVCDSTNNTASDIDNYRLNVWLYLKPIKSVEFINLNVIITSEGMEFSFTQ